jgi:ABC-type transport system involved in multi-copper enzyme maturation permease subunit
MTAATLATTRVQSLPPADLTGPAGVPFGRLVRTELRKLTDTRAGTWLLAAIVTITPIVVAVMLFTAKPQSLTYVKFVDITQTPQKFLLPLLGILTITTEWSQRTGLLTFTLAPHRGRVLRAKATATFLLGLLVIAAAFGTAAIGNLLGAGLRHGNGSWSFGVSGFRDILIVQFTGLAQGLAFGMLLLISAAAIIAYYVLPTLSSFAFTSIPGLKSIKAWFDLNSAQTPLYNHDITGHGWVQLLCAVLIWVALPAVLGVARVLRSEIKST